MGEHQRPQRQLGQPPAGRRHHGYDQYPSQHAAYLDRRAYLHAHLVEHRRWPHLRWRSSLNAEDQDEAEPAVERPPVFLYLQFT